ncbi:MAG TPA: HD domain-containing phosphohydrolase [Candidatus Hydrothermia bacterium]|nr:HD domain-containing protein [Candidatus Hydrothermae bacterium]MDD3648987.1 HD domain-containing protein [Candidatus Hydrothermia bacterium]HOK23228.1 HD domain-containing phosphohydrolase [Candidatus Hydrothermia bacterium]HOL23932.1 HD domain-containing phosphohydrolase [Candidatus Hydrothermia bacterium]HOP31811.1 HD domain-containing phosphohydrolase [Candidatus Hydrothermia bacterium]
MGFDEVGSSRHFSIKHKTIRSYLNQILFGRILPVVAFLMVLTLIFSYYQYKYISNRVFDGIQDRVDLIISESVSGVSKLSGHYKNDIMNMLKDVSAYVEHKLQEGLEYEDIDFLSYKLNYREKFPEDVFNEINYYVISKSGKVIWTDYPPDEGLDIGNFSNFWTSLNKALENGDVFHQSGFEVVSGKMRIYAYHRLSNGDIFEVGLSLNTEQFMENLSKLKGLSIYLEDVGIYNVAGVPLSQNFPEFPQKILKFHPFRRELVGEIKIQDFPPYEQKLLLFARLNFFSVFSIVLFSFCMFLVLFFFLFFVFLDFSKKSKKELNVLERALSSFKEDRTSYVDPSLTRITEVKDILDILNQSVHEINEDERRNRVLFRELKESFYDFAERLALAAEGYDPETGEHIRRVKYLTKLLVEKLNLPDDLKEEIINFSVLHDVGKVYIPLSILNKPGPLDDEEWELMKQHTLFARRLLAHPRFKTALEIALYHHENYGRDGHPGYPFGISGEAIPISGRIMKFVDVYDALRSRRPYKEPYSHEEAIRIMREGDSRTSPEDFDPKLMRIFLEEIEKADLSEFYHY